MRKWIDLFESEAFEMPDDSRDDAVYADMMSRANLAEVKAWLLQNGNTEEDLADPDTLAWEFRYWLDQEQGIRVYDGAVTFWRLEGDAERLIGDNPVVLYHFTSSTAAAKIKKEGLVSGMRSVNRASTEGVFLTTEASGPAVRGYLYNALRGKPNAYGVRIKVLTRLSELEPDPDDAHLSSGRHQFMTDHIAPSQIVYIERAYG